jgi:hypothetical protein
MAVLPLLCEDYSTNVLGEEQPAHTGKGSYSSAELQGSERLFSFFLAEQRGPI